MAEVIRMPLLSDTMKEGKIIAWLKNVGDAVTSDDVLAEVETDKAVMEVVGYVDGTLLYQGVEAGASAAVNQIIAIVGDEGEDYSALLTEEPSEASSQAESVSVESPPATATPTMTKPEIEGTEVILMPLLSDTMKEGKIVAWLKNVGDTVASDDVLAEVETDKAVMEVVGYADGTLLYQSVPAGEAVPVNDIIAIVGPEGTDISALIEYYQSKPNEDTSTEPTTETPAPPSNTASTPASNPAAAPSDDSRVKASPLARQMAKSQGINLNTVTGTGPGGRIVKRDIENYDPSAAAASTTTIPAAMPSSGYTDVPLSQMRSVIATRLGESKFSAPHFYLTVSIEMDALLSSRKQINDISDVRISVNDLLVKITSMALQKHPDVNSSFMGDFIRINHDVNIGIAVAIDDGLIVPVMKNANLKSLSQIAQESNVLIDKAKDKKLQPDEFSGNTFTISNLGMMGIEQFTAIINPPDACILAVGATQATPVYDSQGQLQKKMIMKVTMSCDHRVVDGAKGAAFLQTLKAYIENPLAILL